MTVDLFFGLPVGTDINGSLPMRLPVPMPNPWMLPAQTGNFSVCLCMSSLGHWLIPTSRVYCSFIYLILTGQLSLLIFILLPLKPFAIRIAVAATSPWY